MNRWTILTIALVLILQTTGFSSDTKYHPADMPDPESFNAHFGDMDTNGDDLVSWEEFSNHFKNAEIKGFRAIDANQDNAIDHEEWHAFKAAHGLKHHD
jgi:hypothetical protein